MWPLVARYIFIIYFTLVEFTKASEPEARHLIGVPPDKHHLYEKNLDNKFHCLDGSGTIEFSSVNDDYCDCRDASDEPGSAACPHGRFFCQNVGYKPLSIPAGWVNDGRCDCCDGTDEMSGKIVCHNDCYVLGEQWRNEQEQLRAIAEQGSLVRNQYKEFAVHKRNNATQLLEQHKREMSEKEQAIKLLEDDLNFDFGMDSVFYPLKGECFKYNDLEYTYSLCPFDRAIQESQNGAHTELGKWADWIGPVENKYSAQKYDNGLQCWNGPARSAIVKIHCGIENRLTSVKEPSRCEYLFDFETPAACPDLRVAETSQEAGQQEEPTNPTNEPETTEPEDATYPGEQEKHDEL